MNNKKTISLFVFLGLALGLGFTNFELEDESQKGREKIASIEESKVYRALGSYHALNVNNKAGLPNKLSELSTEYVNGCIVVLLDALHNETYQNKPIDQCLSKVL